MLTAQILVIVATAALFSWILTVNGVPQAITGVLQALELEPWAFLMAVNIILLIVGCFLDPTSAIIVLTPLLMPLVKSLGIDPIHFGIIMTVNIAIGMFTPPFGLNIFVAQSVLGVPLETIYRGVLPFAAVQIVALLIITYWPALSLILTATILNPRERPHAHSIGRCSLAALGALAFAAPAPQPASAQTVMKLANATINDVQHEWQKLFAAALQKRIGDKVKVEIYPASQLGAIPRMVEGVLLGTIEAFITPTSFVTNPDPRFQIFDVPGLFASPEHVHAVIHDPAYRDHMETMFLNRGLRDHRRHLQQPDRVLTKKPAPTLGRLKGLKVRTFASPLQIEPMKAIGAIPVPLALTEVIPQLQSGGLDGMLAGMPILTAFKYYDVAKYVTDLNFAQIVTVNVVNEAWFQAQPKDVQDAIRAAGREAEQQAFPWGVENVKKIERGLARQQGRDPEAAAAGAGVDDAVVRRARHQDRRAESGGEGRVRRSCRRWSTPSGRSERASPCAAGARDRRARRFEGRHE